MKKIITGFLLLLPFLNKAQEDQKQSATKIGINYSVDYDYRSFKLHNSNSNTKDYFDQKEKPVFGFNTGVTILHQFKKGIILEGGIQFSRFGEKLTNVYTTSPENPENHGKGEVFYHYDYLSVPVKVGYGFQIGKRITLSATTGLSAHYFITQRSDFKVTYEDGSKGEIKTVNNKYLGASSYDQFNVVSVSSIGIDIQLFRAFSVRFEPSARFFLNSFTDDTFFIERPYSLGMNTTVFYKFGQKEKK